MQWWNPFLEQDIQAIEDVQRRAIRQVSGLRGTYEEKLDQLGLTTLKDRRTRGDLIETYKIVQQIDDIPIGTFFQMAGANHGHATRVAVTVTGDDLTTPEDLTVTDNHNFAVPRAHNDFRKYTFSHRVVTPWNNLPSEIKNASSVNNFKNLYDHHME